MKRLHLISAISGVAIAMGTFTAAAEQNGTWYVDDDERVHLNIPGSRDKYIAAGNTASVKAPKAPVGNHNWYVDDDYQVHLGIPGSRDKYLTSPATARMTAPAAQAGNHNWYVDDNYQVHLNIPGSRDKYTRM